MIRYHCKNCNIETETSECPVCKGRTDLNSQIFWCKECNIPIYEEECSLCGSKCEYITTDLRPVFPEERLLLEIILGEPFKYINSSVWNGAGNRYIIDGKRIKVSINKLILKDIKEVIRQLKDHKGKNNYDYFNEITEKFVEANKNRFNYLTSEATEFIKRASEGYALDEMFVSFSGGKDSAVISNIVVKALSRPDIIHIFGDTTLEFPTTIEYVKRFKVNNRRTPMISAMNKEKNFMEMCDLVGPPSRVMRWCCTVFKTGAITRKINSTFKDKKRLLTFYGVRRSESVSRSKYEREESEKTKILKQNIVSPIIDWFDFDIWLYILKTRIDFNDAYRLGFARVGCWCCPNNSGWSQFLSSIYMPEQYSEWRNFLISFARRIGKIDAEVYVDSGNWKARQGGNGVEFSKNTFVSFEPCALENNSFNYELKRPITEQLYELFKPFGWISKELGNERLGEAFVVDKNNNPIIRLQGRVGTNILKVSIFKLPIAKTKNIRDARMKIECQLTKYQMCVACNGCSSVCMFNAISIKKNVLGFQENEIAAATEIEENIYSKVSENVYVIDNEKCTRCGECINHFDGGCYMRKVLITKRGE